MVYITGTGEATEDAQHNTGDNGFMVLAVRRDADTSMVDATNDYTPLQVNATGSLKVTVGLAKDFELTSQLAATTLNNGGVLAASVTGLITLTSSTGFDAGTGYVRIEDEVISYDLTGVGANQINILARGQFDTTDVEHANGVNVGELYDSGILTLDTWTQVITKVECDQDCNMIFIWYSDAGGITEIRRLTPSYTAANGYDYLSAPAFGPYVRYTIAPSTSTTTTAMYFTTEFTRTAIHSQLFTLNSAVFGSMISQLTRSVLVAQQLGGSTYANVRSTAADELLTNTLASDRGMTVSTQQTVGSATTYFMLIDLSDTTTYPHAQTDGIVIDHISWSTLANANSNGTMDIGVVTEVDATNGSCDFFYHADWVGESGGGAGAQTYIGATDFTPNGIDATIVAGAPTRLLSSEGVSADVALQTDVTLNGVVTVAPAAGDVIMRIVNDNASSCVVSVTIGYHSI